MKIGSEITVATGSQFHHVQVAWIPDGETGRWGVVYDSSEYCDPIGYYHRIRSTVVNFDGSVGASNVLGWCGMGDSCSTLAGDGQSYIQPAPEPPTDDEPLVPNGSCYALYFGASSRWGTERQFLFSEYTQTGYLLNGYGVPLAQGNVPRPLDGTDLVAGYDFRAGRFLYETSLGNLLLRWDDGAFTNFGDLTWNGAAARKGSDAWPIVFIRNAQPNYLYLSVLDNR